MRERLDIEATYGLVFVLDPENARAEIPVTGNTCTNTTSCVAIPVRAYVDGPVTLEVGSGSTPTLGGIEIFAGPIDTPSRRLAIVLPEGDEPVSTRVSGTRTTITVTVDDLQHTAAVAVRVSST